MVGVGSKGKSQVNKVGGQPFLLKQLSSYILIVDFLLWPLFRCANWRQNYYNNIFELLHENSIGFFYWSDKQWLIFSYYQIYKGHCNLHKRNIFTWFLSWSISSLMSLLKSILKLSTMKRIKFIDKCQSKAAFYWTT